jgi:putative toxin-antitoxin system antitoxin component (TIGR02293 family)
MADYPTSSDSLSQALLFLGEPPPAAYITPTATGRSVRDAGSLGAYLPGRAIEAPELLPRVVEQLARRLGVDEARVLAVAGIAARTFHRRRQAGATLTSAESDRVLRIARVCGLAERVFGDPDKSNRWLSKDSAVLGAAPLALLATDAGAREVEAELDRIDWGDFA